MLICFPDRQRPENPWPPAAPFWDPVLRPYLFELCIAMNEWAENFRDSKGALHSRVIDAGLDTMRAWLDEPGPITDNLLYGTSEVICQSRHLQPSEMNMTIGSWDPLKETEEDFMNRVRTTADNMKRSAKNQISEMKKLLVSFDT